MLIKGLFCTFKINIEYILLEVKLSKVVTLEPLIKLMIISDKISPNFIVFLMRNFHFSGIESNSGSHWK